MRTLEFIIVVWVMALILIGTIGGIVCLFIAGNIYLAGFLLAVLVAPILVSIALIYEK